MSYQYKKSSILYELEQAIKKKVAEKPRNKEQCQRVLQNSAQKRKSQNPRQSAQRLPSRHKQACKLITKHENYTLFNNQNLMHVQTDSKLSEPKKLNHRKIDKLFSLINYALSSADKAMKYINYANFQGEFAVKLFKSDRQNLMNQMRNLTAEELMDSTHREDTGSKVTVPSVIILQEENLKLKKELAILEKENERSRQGHPKDMDLTLLLRQLQIQKYKQSIYRLRGNQFVERLSTIVEKQLKYESLLRKGHASSTEFDSIFRSLISERNNLCKEGSHDGKKTPGDDHHSEIDKINKIKQEKQELMREIEVCKKKLGEIADISALKSELDSYKKEYLAIYARLQQQLDEGQQANQQLSMEELLAKVLNGPYNSHKNQYESQISVLRTQKQILEKQLQQKEQKSRALDRQNVQLLKKVQQSHEEVFGLKNDLHQAKKKNKLDEQDLQQIGRQNVGLKEKIEDLENKLREYETQYQGERDGEQQNMKNEELIKKMNSQLSELEAQNKNLTEVLQNSRKEIIRLCNKIAKMEADKELLREQFLNEMQALSEQKDQVIQQLKKEHEKEKVSAEKGEGKQLEELKKANDRLDKSLLERQQQLKLKNEHLEQTKGFLREKTVENFSKINQITSLKQNQQRLVAKIEQLSLQISQIQEEHQLNAGEMQKKQVQIRQLQSEIEVLKAKIQEQDKQQREKLESRVQECQDREGALLDREYMLKEKEETLAQKQKTLLDIEKANHGQQAKLQSIKNEINEKQSELNRKLNQLQQKQKFFQRNQTQLQQFQQKLKQKEQLLLKENQKDQNNNERVEKQEEYKRTIEQLQIKNAQAGVEKQKLQGQLAGIKMELSQLLATYDAITAKLEALESQKEAHLNEEQHKINILEQQLKVVKQKHERQLVEAGKKQTMLLERCGVLDNELVIKAQAIDELNEQQTGLESEMATKKLAITQLEAQVQVKDKQILEKVNLIHNFETYNQQLREQIENLQAQITQKQAQLAHNSAASKQMPSEQLQKLLSKIQTMQQQIEQYQSQQQQRQADKETTQKKICQLSQQLEQAKSQNVQTQDKYAQVVMKLQLTILNAEQLLQERDRLDDEVKQMQAKLDELAELNRQLGQWKNVQTMYEKQYCNLIKRILKGIIDLEEIGNVDDMNIRTLLEVGSQKVIEHRMRVRDQESNEKKLRKEVDEKEDEQLGIPGRDAASGLFEREEEPAQPQIQDQKLDSKRKQDEAQLKDVQQFDNFEEKMNSSLISQDAALDHHQEEDPKEQKIHQDTHQQKIQSTEQNLEEKKEQKPEQKQPDTEQKEEGVENIEDFNDYKSEKMNESMLSNPDVPVPPKAQQQPGLDLDQFNDNNHSELDSSLMSETNLPQVPQPQPQKQQTKPQNHQVHGADHDQIHGIGMDLSHISNVQPQTQNNSMEFDNFLDFQTNNLNQSMVSEKGPKVQSAINNLNDFNDFESEKLSQSMISEKQIDVPVHKENPKQPQNNENKPAASLSLDNFDQFQSQKMNVSIMSNQEPTQQKKEQADFDQFGEFKQDSMNSSMMSDKQ